TALDLSDTSVYENVAANTIVGTFSTTDPDAGNTFTYSLVAGAGDTDNASFTISGSSLRLTPSADYETKNSYAVRVRTTDAGGLFYEEAFTISITNVSEAPTLAAISKSGFEDITVTFTAANFTSAFTDAENDSLASITVATLPATGTLKLSGTNITASQVILLADLGNLTYVPAANENGAKIFTVTASDGTSSSAAAPVTLTLTAVNDVPSYALPAGEDDAAGETWTAQDSGDRAWYSLTSSADGTRLAAVENGGYIYTSADAGTTWTARDSVRDWIAITSSSDGTKLAAALYPSGGIYTSTDSGVNWTLQSQAPSITWWCIASSADGTKLVAGARPGSLYTSSDSGVTWTERLSDVSGDWMSVASSADGTKLAAASNAADGQIYTSTDSGETWTARGIVGQWSHVASSSDGTKLAATVNSTIYTSADSGVTWTARQSGSNWTGIASSADGTKLAAVGFESLIYTSTDSGVTWTGQAGSSPQYWNHITSSADGSRLATMVGGGPIYTSVGSYSPDSVTVAEDAGAQSIANVATSIFAGPEDESSQTVSFTVTNSNNALFGVQPTMDASGTLTFTSAADAHGSATVSVVAVDSGGIDNGGVNTSAAQTFTLSIGPVNDAPIITSNGGGGTASISIAESTTPVTTVTATDAEVTATQTLTYSKSGPDAAKFTLNPSSGELAFTTAPDFDIPGDANADNIYLVTVTATDSNSPSASDSQDLNVTVTNVNETPVIARNTSAITVNEGNSASNTGTFSDPEGNATITLMASLGTATPNNGAGTWSWSYTPADGPDDSQIVTITANDGVNPVVTTTFALTVNNVAPTALAQSVATNEDTAKDITLAASDPGADTQTFSIVNGPTQAQGTLSAVTGNQVTFTPALNFNGSASFTFKATDSDGAASNTATVSITIEPVNDQPVVARANANVT
ncbi:MAG: tandem-95 repeat protein, partial [Verrucomicrobiaceae bacterium]